jgi:predicted house-cleaning noncanonical NTP pyrophosphatase (MazG superfamily)
MTPIKYNKLVRDRIPEIIKADGWKPTVTQLDKEAHITALKAKLIEECAEYVGSGDVSELADLYEVLICLSVVAHGESSQTLEGRADANREKRGSLLAGLFLVEITA